MAAGAAAAAEMLEFADMSVEQLRQWVEANPGRVNDQDSEGRTPLSAAAGKEEGLSLVVWLLDEKGADVNATDSDGDNALHYARTPDILTALLNRGTDPIMTDPYGMLPLMSQALTGSVDVVAHLLRDPRVRATVDAQTRRGTTALRHACDNMEKDAVPKAHLLLQAGVNPTITDID